MLTIHSCINVIIGLYTCVKCKQNTVSQNYLSSGTKQLPGGFETENNCLSLLVCHAHTSVNQLMWGFWPQQDKDRFKP